MFITVLEEFIRQKGITSAKMLSDLDMNKSSVLNWKTRGTIPGAKVLQKIADYFGVPVSSFLNLLPRFVTIFYGFLEPFSRTKLVLFLSMVIFDRL